MNCCNTPIINPFVPGWGSFIDFVPTVPQLYWNVDSNEQRYHLLCRQLHKLVCYADMLGGKINLDHAAINELEMQFEQFKESGFLDYYEEQIEAWINANMADIIADSIKMVFFGLTLDGYFVAYIPDSWSDIIFDTGMVYGTDEYGRLILLMDVDGARPVMPDHASQTALGELQHIMQSIEQRVANLEATI